jgi:hypothetical protein
MSEFTSGSAKIEARVDNGLRIASLALTAYLTAVSATETVTHANELCVAGKGAAAMAVYETTGHFPAWTPPEYNPIGVTSGTDAMNSLLNGSLMSSTTQPSSCF